MKQTYALGVTRKISNANHNVYINGVIHPDRVMNDHDFVYISEGYWEIYQNNELFKLLPGDLILLHAKEHHYGKIPCINNTKTMFLHVNYDADDNNDIKQHSIPYIPLDTVIHCQNNSKINTIFQEIISIFLSNYDHKEIKLSVLFNLLLCELYELTALHKDEINIAEKVAQIIQENPQYNFTNKQLAEKLFLNERTLMRYFKNQYGTSIYSYQLNLKMKSIRSFLLDHPNVKLHEVAKNFGFYDEFHLSKTFKKEYGISPNNFKNTELKNK